MNYFATGGPIETMDTNNVTSTNLTGLVGYTNYTIFVRARTVILGNSSTIVMITTNEDGKHLMLQVDVIALKCLVFRLMPGLH